MGPEPRSKYIGAGLVLAQLSVAVFASRLCTWKYFCMVYLVGAPLTQALFLAIHELSHNLFFQRSHSNHLFAMVCNLPIVFPFSESFRFYHLQHHRNQGVHGVDSDIPSEWEVRIFRGFVGKFVWYNFQIVFYALRPLLTKRQPMTSYLCLNIILQLTFDILFVTVFGIRAIVFLLLSVLVAGGFGLHPTSAHFISEHYVFDRRQQSETFDYHGPLNYVTWNVGWHENHHNFPNVAWSNLPKIAEVAPNALGTSQYTIHGAPPLKFVLSTVSLTSRKTVGIKVRIA